MQSTHKIAGSAAAGFAAYLTTGASRGDYYVGGELEGEGGSWHGSSEALGELGLDPTAPVGRSELVALMDGRSPATGEPIRRVGGDGSRVAGVDATFSAPKSVSALWAVSTPYRRAQIEVAHRKAVASAVGRIERDVALVRRRTGGELRWETARSLVAAEFVHTASRLTRDQERDGVPDPQLHSHVVILAAQREDGRFAAVDSRELFRSQRANGAWYRAELAHELRQLGLDVRRRTGRDGRFFELQGVPEELTRRWSRRSEVIERAAREFRDRYGRAPHAGELSSIAVATRGTKTVTTELDVSASWRAVGEEYGLTRDRVESLFADRRHEPKRVVRDELLADVTRERSMIETRELEARVFELAAGVERPDAAREHLAELERSGELVALEGGWWTTRELRELEQHALNAARERTHDPVGVVSADAQRAGMYIAAHRRGHEISEEQTGALETITGEGGVVVLVGAAGTGKGAVLDAAKEAWERAGHRVIGTAVAGATAQRLGTDAGIGETMTTDSLIGRVEHDKLQLDDRTVVVMDEAGMADTRRLAALVEVTRQSDSKLVLAGDPAQLSPIGAGGLFNELKDSVPTARLSEVHRASHEWERGAWQRLRDGDAEKALAEYQGRDRLHMHETRAEAGERMVADWATTRAAHPGERVVMLTDASNHELDRLNQQAQQRRLDAGELGREIISLPDRPYGLRSGDEITFTAQHRVSGEHRVENGTRGDVIAASERDSRVQIRTEEPKPRDIEIATRDFDGLRLAYAQHVYKAQGLTADRALVLTGGWQTNRETTYVALTRAREQTDIYTSREELGHAGIDTDAISRLAQRANTSRAQQASISRDRVEPDHEPSRAVSELREALARDAPREGERDDAPARGRFAEELRKAFGRDEPRERDGRAESGREAAGFAEELRRIREEQHERDRDRSDGLEL
ncbi:MAG TPA: MobF family relaxase [Solirubrobacteraceae bacterium]|nr:MobF family relaxase [Solirubrobacteraceae bacterium]